MDYSIGEFSAICGISIHTLRYYEKERLIVPARHENNRRRYSESDIVWLAFIKRLKETGMPIKEIKEYADLRSQGDETLEARLEMLIRHRAELSEQIRAMQEHRCRLDDKIEYYQCEISMQKEEKRS